MKIWVPEPEQETVLPGEMMPGWRIVGVKMEKIG